ncbi:jg203, partial [Pararge aegeria aegeria]
FFLQKVVLTRPSQTKFVPPAKLVHAMEDKSIFHLPNNQRFVELDCSQAFTNLTKVEKCYAHYLSQAAWYGGLIVLVQTSPESPKIFSLLHRIFIAESVEDLKKSSIDAGVSEDDFQVIFFFESHLIF